LPLSILYRAEMPGIRIHDGEIRRSLHAHRDVGVELRRKHVLICPPICREYDRLAVEFHTWRVTSDRKDTPLTVPSIVWIPHGKASGLNPTGPVVRPEPLRTCRHRFASGKGLAGAGGCNPQRPLVRGGCVLDCTPAGVSMFLEYSRGDRSPAMIIRTSGSSAVTVPDAFKTPRLRRCSDLPMSSSFHLTNSCVSAFVHGAQSETASLPLTASEPILRRLVWSNLAPSVP